MSNKSNDDGIIYEKYELIQDGLIWSCMTFGLSTFLYSFMFMVIWFILLWRIRDIPRKLTNKNMKDVLL